MSVTDAPDIGMAEAFGRDPILEASVRQLVRDHRIVTCVETGSWRGYTAARFAQFVEGVYTIELEPLLHAWTRRTLAHAPNATAHLGNSSEMLRSLIPGVRKPAIYYLDAHWNDYWPILDELAAIAELDAGPCVIVVHDVQVPDRDFKFDTYAGQPLNFEYMKPQLDRLKFKWKHSFNRDAAGYRIGALFVEPA